MGNEYSTQHDYYQQQKARDGKCYFPHSHAT
jgi:hypothetical protein